MRTEKKLIEKEYHDKISQARGLVVTEYRTLTSQSLSRLRRELSALSADYLVVKNRLFKKVLEETGFQVLTPFFEGQTAVALAGDNLPGLAQALVNFMKEEGAPQIKAAVWGGDFFDQNAIKRLADLPPREVLLSQVFRSIQDPLAGLVGLFNQLLTSLMRALKEISGKKEV